MKDKTIVLFAIVVLVLFAASAAVASDALKVRVKVPLANVRKTADLNGAVLQQLAAGTVLDVLEKKGEWYRVTLTVGGAQAEGYVNYTVVEEVAEGVTQRPAAQPAQPVQRPAAQPPQRPAEQPETAASEPAFKKLFISVGYQMGFGTESQALGFTFPAYQETAQIGLDYKLQKGNTIDVAAGLFLGKSWGVKVGVDLTSRNFEETTTFAVPHPLWIGVPREGTITGTGLKVSENDITLNLFYLLRFGKMGLELYGGPCYALSTATIISDITAAETGYPYLTNSVVQLSSDVKSNAFGFDAGASISYLFGSSVGLYVNASYVSAKAKYEPGNNLPTLSVTLGGLKAGGGIKIML